MLVANQDGDDFFVGNEVKYSSLAVVDPGFSAGGRLPAHLDLLLSKNMRIEDVQSPKPSLKQALL